MDLSTIKHLNQINQAFYNQVAVPFSQSRELPWAGWNQLIPLLQQLHQSPVAPHALDVGCGNGRWARFLAHIWDGHPWSYVGLDNNQSLLQEAQHHLTEMQITGEVLQTDLVHQLINNHSILSHDRTKFELITLFGVIHHIPSFELRQKLMSQLTALLAPQGVLIISAWQFAEFDRFIKKQVQPAVLNLDPTDLEPNDYILDWQSGPASYRYCHFLTEPEFATLVSTLDLQIIDRFRADGKEQQLNQYYVLRKNETLHKLS